MHELSSRYGDLKLGKQYLIYGATRNTHPSIAYHFSIQTLEALKKYESDEHYNLISFYIYCGL